MRPKQTHNMKTKKKIEENATKLNLFLIFFKRI